MTSQLDTMTNLGLETESVDIPVYMDVEPDASGGKWTLNLYADGCLECASLMVEGTVDYSKEPCHFSNGNNHCPAVSLKVAFVGKRILAARRIKAAQDKGDTQALLRQMTKLADLSEADRKYVLTQLGIKFSEATTQVEDSEESPQVETIKAEPTEVDC